jgi:hypothetical protein
VLGPGDSSQQQPPGDREVGGEIQATWSNVPALGLPPRMTSAIDGTQISSAGQLRSE